MKRITNKLLHVLLALVMLAGLLPATALAEEVVYDVAFFDGFEFYDRGTQPVGWTFLDADGDEHQWYVASNESDIAQQTPHTGAKLLTSESYDNSTNSPLIPDNWAITPAIMIPENAVLSFWIRGQGKNAAAEKMAVYVGTSPSADAMTKVGGDYTASADYHEYKIDLSAYAGQTIYIGFRHYNVTDMFMLNLDDVMVRGYPGYAILSASITLDAPAIGVHPDYTAKFPDFAQYYSAESIEWWTDSENTVMNPTDVFKAGKEYGVTIHLTAKDGFQFIDTTAMVNGQTAQVSMEGDQLEVKCAFPMLTETPEEVVHDGYFFDGFEAYEPGTQPAGWTFLDEDGDTHQWYVDTADTSHAHSDSRVLTSASYDNNNDGALTPDNWAITPAIRIPENALLSFWIRGQDPNWTDEKMAVYVGTSPSADVMTKVGGDYTASGEYQEYRIDLSSYAGQTVYIGFRHYKVTNMYRLNLDDVKVTGYEESDILSASITLDAPAIGARPDYTAEFPDGVHYCSDTNDSAYWSNGLAWFDKTGGNTEPVDPESGVFLTGHVYQVMVNLKADDGFQFIDTTTVMVNGQTAQASMDGDQLKVSYTFPMLMGEDVCFFDGFEAYEPGTQPAGWTFLDEDGDTHQWYVDVANNSHTHSGDKILTSESYYNPAQDPLTPDNWAITPAITVPQNAGLSFWIRGQDSNWPAEKMAVYVGTSPRADAMTKVGGDYTASDEYQEYGIDLSSYAGQTVYIGFRHYNVTNMFRLNLDDVKVMGDVVPMPEFKGHQLVLSGQIGVKFGMNLSMLSEDEKADSYMEFTINGRTTRINTSDAVIAEDGRYFYTCFVTSIQMAEPITAVFHYNEDTVQQTYSVKEYIDYLDGHAFEFSEAAVNLAHAIADYGHYAQPFLSAANNWTIGTDYAEMDRFFASSYDLDAVRGNVGSYQLALTKGDSKVDTAFMRLTLDSETALSVRLTVADDSELSATATFHGNAYQAVKQNDGSYIIKVTNIPAAWLGDTVTITGTAGGDFTITVSALSYVHSVLNSDTMSTDAKNAVASLYYYYTNTVTYRTESNQ